MKRRVNLFFNYIYTKILNMKIILCIAMIFMAFLPLCVTQKIVVDNHKQKSISTLTTEVRNRCNQLITDIGKQEYLNYQLGDSINAQIDQFTYSYSGRIMLVASNFVVIKDTYVVHENKTIVSEPVIKAMEGEFSSKYVPQEGFLEITIPIKNADTGIIEGVLVAIVDDKAIVAESNNLNKVFRASREIFFVLSILCSFAVVHFVFRPLKMLTIKVKDIAGGHIDRRLDDKNSIKEVRELAEGVNMTLERLKTLDDTRQEFVSNVSHELKTPITSIKVLADSLINQDKVPIEVYKDFMNDISEEIDRESKIIEDLLALVRMDRTAASLNISTQNVNELVEHVLKRLKPIAAEKNIELVLESFRPVVAELDEVKMNLVITNLVENAIKYNVANGSVRVSVNADYKFFYITVADTGIGIPEESKDMIFERFYRVDKARSRQTGGTGLGLAITKNAILMHHGEIKVHSKDGEGSTFTVKIPLNYAAH